MTYGLGQLGRQVGGAGMQGNPFSADGGAFRGGLEGFKGGFSLRKNQVAKAVCMKEPGCATHTLF